MKPENPKHPSKKCRVAILGTGNIGTDLLAKVRKSQLLQCTIFAGRNAESNGIRQGIEWGIQTTDQGMDFLEKHADLYDLVFDATSAESHRKHALRFREMRKTVIDMTPAKIGVLCVPVINGRQQLHAANINMITCGGQAAIPLAHALSLANPMIDYIEVVSSIASASAGTATRQNIDEYLDTTESAIRQFTACPNVKAILSLNPAVPCVHMQTTVYAQIQQPDLDHIKHNIRQIVAEIQNYVPGYRLVLAPTLQDQLCVVSARISGAGDYLPEYAGNLDIINCAAIRMAEHIMEAS